MSFSDLGLSEKVLEAVTAAGYSSPTPIQAQAIPHALARRDVLGIAQTGTGKTAAFTLPMLHMLETGRARARMPRTLILEPTRELAAQVEESFVNLGANHKLSVALLIGGVSFADQDAKITRGADVLIATPGRLLDHFERGKLLLTGIEILVIDEADRMLDMGFIPDIERICKMVPFTRQTLFFSATMPPEIQRLTEAFLSNPVKIEVARPSSTAATITQRLVASGSEAHDKRAVLRKLIRGATDLQNAIIFCNRKRDVAIVLRSLERHGFNVVALHGDMDQMSRMQALDRFRNGDANLLVASDVAARGLDIPEVSHVFNYDVPFHAEDYVHRIGRTGRAGRSGYAASIVTRHDTKALAAIEALSGQSIEWEGPHIDELPADEAQESERGHGPSRGRKGDRMREREPSRSSSRDSARGAVKDHGREQRHDRSADRGFDRAQDKPAEKNWRDNSSQSLTNQSSGNQSFGQSRQGTTVRPGERLPPVWRNRQEDDEVFIGFGNHVPAFLLRPVKMPAPEPDSILTLDEEIALEAAAAAEITAAPPAARESRSSSAAEVQSTEQPAAEQPSPGEAPAEEKPARRQPSRRRTSTRQSAPVPVESDVHEVSTGETAVISAPEVVSETTVQAEEKPAAAKTPRKRTPRAKAGAATAAPSDAATSEAPVIAEVAESAAGAETLTATTAEEETPKKAPRKTAAKSKTAVKTPRTRVKKASAEAVPTEAAEQDATSAAAPAEEAVAKPAKPRRSRKKAVESVEGAPSTESTSEADD